MPDKESFKRKKEKKNPFLKQKTKNIIKELKTFIIPSQINTQLFLISEQYFCAHNLKFNLFYIIKH